MILRYLLKQSLGLLRISRPSRAFSQHLLLKVFLSHYRWFISCNKFNIYFFPNPNGGILSIPVKRKSKSFKPNPLISLFATDAKNNSTSNAILLITVHWLECFSSSFLKLITDMKSFNVRSSCCGDKKNFIYSKFATCVKVRSMPANPLLISQFLKKFPYLHQLLLQIWQKYHDQPNQTFVSLRHSRNDLCLFEQ